MLFLYALLTLIACAFLNRVRGDDRWMRKDLTEPGPKWLPGRPLYYVTPLIALLAWAWGSAWSLLVFALAYMIWGLFPWGRWFDLERMSTLDRQPDLFERTLESMTTSDYGAFFVRHLIVIFPLALFGWSGVWMGAVFAAFAVATYDLAWRLHRDNPIWVAEMGTGLLWGFLILLL